MGNWEKGDGVRESRRENQQPPSHVYSDETLFNTVLVKGEDLPREALKMAHAKIPLGGSPCMPRSTGTLVFASPLLDG